MNYNIRLKRLKKLKKNFRSQDRLWLNQIGLSTGILSALAAISAMQAGYLANEGTLAQIRTVDQWDYYQAKSTKLHIEQSTVTILQSLQKPVPPAIAAEITGKITQSIKVACTIRNRHHYSELLIPQSFDFVIKSLFLI